MNELKLQIIEGPNAGQELALDGPGVIGRDPAGAGLTLQDPEASRRHASLIPEGQSLDVEDLGSTNGTFVNGQRLTEAVMLMPGDRLRVGTTVLELVLTGAQAEPRFAAVSGGSPDQPPGAPPPPEDPQPPEPAPDAQPPAAPAPPAEPGFAPPPPPPPAPAAAGPLTTQPGQAMQTRDSIMEWLLCELLFGIYAIYWLHRASKEMQAWSGGRIDYNPTQTILALTLGWFLIVPGFVALVSFQGRIREAQRMAGLEPTAGFWGFFLRNILLGYGYKWNQDMFNEIAVREPQA